MGKIVVIIIVVVFTMYALCGIVYIENNKKMKTEILEDMHLLHDLFLEAVLDSDDNLYSIGHLNKQDIYVDHEAVLDIYDFYLKQYFESKLDKRILNRIIFEKDKMCYYSKDKLVGVDLLPFTYIDSFSKKDKELIVKNIVRFYLNVYGKKIEVKDCELIKGGYVGMIQICVLDDSNIIFERDKLDVLITSVWIQ